MEQQGRQTVATAEAADREERLEASMAVIQTGRIARITGRNLAISPAQVARAQADFSAAVAHYERIFGPVLV